MIIEKVHAREILDSRGNPTVEVEASLKSGVVAKGLSVGRGYRPQITASQFQTI